MYVTGWSPCVISRAIPFPVHDILQLSLEEFRVQDLSHPHVLTAPEPRWGWRWLCASRKGIVYIFLEQRNMEYGMYLPGTGQLELEGHGMNLLNDPRLWWSSFLEDQEVSQVLS